MIYCLMIYGDTSSEDEPHFDDWNCCYDNRLGGEGGVCVMEGGEYL